MQAEERRRCLVQTEGGGLKAKVGGLLGVGQAVLGRGWHPVWSLTLSSLASFITKQEGWPPGTRSASWFMLWTVNDYMTQHSLGSYIWTGTFGPQACKSFFLASVVWVVWVLLWKRPAEGGAPLKSRCTRLSWRLPAVCSAHTVAIQKRISKLWIHRLALSVWRTWDVCSGQHSLVGCFVLLSFCFCLF